MTPIQRTREKEGMNFPQDVKKTQDVKNKKKQTKQKRQTEEQMDMKVPNDVSYPGVKMMVTFPPRFP